MNSLPGQIRTVYLGLGGNQGDRLGHLQAGLTALQEHPALQVVRTSGVFETRYEGPGQQAPYLNACVELRCELSAHDLLRCVKAIEASRGRLPDSHMQPRPLDLDLLFFEQDVLTEPELTLPHPRMRSRAFVLQPLAEIAGEQKFPDSGETVAQACAKICLENPGEVERRPELALWPIVSG